MSIASARNSSRRCTSTTSAYGVELVGYGPVVEDWTRTCLTVKSNNEFNETEILGTGPTIGQDVYDAFFKAYETLLADTKFVSMSGSWPKNTVAANYDPFIEKAESKNIKTFIDCSGDMMKSALQQKPYAVHINHHEGFDIFKTSDAKEISNQLGKYCGLTAITFGDKGLYLGDGKELVHALSKIDHVISAVGSGDSLMAGIVVASKRNYSLEDTAKLAAASGAANCIREDLGMFYKKDVERLFDACKTVVEPIN